MTHQIIPMSVKTVWGEERVYQFAEWPFVIKRIVTKAPLSVQVHPKVGLPFDGEIWYVMKAEPESCLYLGFSRETNRQEIFHAIQQEIIVSFMKCYHPTPGDCFWIPAGTIHCLGAGLSVLEIRPVESRTLRLYDWNRQPERPLHLEEGLNELCLEKNQL